MNEPKPVTVSEAELRSVKIDMISFAKSKLPLPNNWAEALPTLIEWLAHWHLTTLHATIAERDKEIEKLKQKDVQLIERVWQECEWGWIIDTEKRNWVECGECGQVTDDKSPVQHTPDCFQGYLFNLRKELTNERE